MFVRPLLGEAARAREKFWKPEINSSAYGAMRGAQVRREVQEIDMSIMREAMDKRVLGLPQARPAIASIPFARTSLSLKHACSRWAMAERQRVQRMPYLVCTGIYVMWP